MAGLTRWLAVGLLVVVAGCSSGRSLEIQRRSVEAQERQARAAERAAESAEAAVWAAQQAEADAENARKWETVRRMGRR